MFREHSAQNIDCNMNIIHKIRAKMFALMHNQNVKQIYVNCGIYPQGSWSKTPFYSQSLKVIFLRGLKYADEEQIMFALNHENLHGILSNIIGRIASARLDNMRRLHCDELPMHLVM